MTRQRTRTAKAAALDKENASPSTEDKLVTRDTAAKGTNSSKRSNSTKTVWTSADDAVLVQTLLLQRAAGNQSDSGFKSTAYTACAEALSGSEKVSGGAAKTASSVSNHWAKVCNRYRLCFVHFYTVIPLS
jgi:Myb/SANT-like DNA-binding domain